MPLPTMPRMVGLVPADEEEEPERMNIDPFDAPEEVITRRSLDRLLQGILRRAPLSDAAASARCPREVPPPLVLGKRKASRASSARYRERMLSDPETARAYRERTNASHARSREKMRERMASDPAFAAEVRAARKAAKERGKKRMEAEKATEGR